MLERRFGGEGMRRGARGRPSFAIGSSSPASETHRVAASMSGTSTMTGTVTANGAVAAAMAGTSSMEGMVYAHGAVAAAMAGTSAMDGTAYAHGKVEASMSGTSSMTGTVTATSGEPTIPKTTGLTHHWSARDAGNTVVSGELTVLADLSGNDYHGTPLSGDNGGTIQAAGLNGRDYASYNGTDQSNAYSMPSNMPTFTSSRTYFAVMRFPSGNTPVGYCYGKNQADLAWAPQMMDLSPAKLELQIASGDDYIADDGGFDEWQIWIITHDDDNDDTVVFRYNGSASGSYSGTDVFTSVLEDSLVAIGANLAGGNQAIDFFEGGVYDHVLNGTEIGELESYLSVLTGITIP